MSKQEAKQVRAKAAPKGAKVGVIPCAFAKVTEGKLRKLAPAKDAYALEIDTGTDAGIVRVYPGVYQSADAPRALRACKLVIGIVDAEFDDDAPNAQAVEPVSAEVALAKAGYTKAQIEQMLS